MNSGHCRLKEIGLPVGYGSLPSKVQGHWDLLGCTYCKWDFKSSPFPRQNASQLLSVDVQGGSRGPIKEQATKMYPKPNKPWVAVSLECDMTRGTESRLWKRSPRGEVVGPQLGAKGTAAAAWHVAPRPQTGSLATPAWPPPDKDGLQSYWISFFCLCIQ